MKHPLTPSRNIISAAPEPLPMPKSIFKIENFEWKVRKINVFQSFFLLYEIAMRLILKYFSHIIHEKKI